MTLDRHGLPHADPPAPELNPDRQLLRDPPDTSWLSMECVCCRRPVHASWWQRVTERIVTALAGPPLQ